MQRRHFRSWPIEHQIMQSPSLDAAQAMDLGARGASLVAFTAHFVDWTGLHGLDLVGWRGSTLDAGVSSDPRATKETRESHSCPVHDGSLVVWKCCQRL